MVVLRRRRIRAFAELLGLWALGALPLGAQAPRPTGSDVAVLALSNTLLGAGIASVAARLRGRPVRDALLGGAVGGALGFSGKLLVGATRLPGAPLAGGVLSAAGASVVIDAAVGNSGVREVRLPIGPLRVSVPLNREGRPRMSLNAYEAATLGVFLLRRDLTFSAPLTLKYGTPVFRTRAYTEREPHSFVAGYTVGGAVVLSDASNDRASTLRHELVHVQQQRFLQELLRAGVEEPVRRWGGARRPPRWFEPGVSLPALLWLDDRLGDGNGPLRRMQEWEAGRLGS